MSEDDLAHHRFNMDGTPAGNKQLPLRATRDKPVLKYSGNHLAGHGHGRPPAVPLFNPSDLHNYRQQTGTGTGSYSNEYYYNGGYPNAGVPTTQTQGNTHGLSKGPQLAFSNFAFMMNPVNSNGIGITPAHILATDLGNSVTKTSVKNPYARPLSAKDIQRPEPAGVPTSTAKVGFSHQWSSGSSSSLSSNGSIPSNAPQPPHVQTNSFMRPPSAGYKSEAKEAPPSRTSFRALTRPSTKSTPLSSSSTLHADSSVKVPGNDNIAALQQQSVAVVNTQSDPAQGSYYHTQRVPQPPRPPTWGKPNSVRTSVSHQRKPPLPRQKSLPTELHAQHVATTVPGEAEAKPPSAVHVASVRASSSRYKNTFVKRQISPSNNKTEEQNGASSLIRPDSSANSSASSSRPGSQESGSTIRSGTPAFDTASRVRNLGYTPAKPYSEVSSNTVQVMTTSSAPEKRNTEPHNEDLKPTPKSTSSMAYPSSARLPKPPDTSSHKDSQAGKKMQVANTASGTVYYRKSSKAEEVIHDLSKRRLGDGAPAKIRNMAEKSAAAESGDDEWEDEDEEDDFGGGPACSERQPGDGEDFSDLDSDDDDDALDAIDDDGLESDDESEVSRSPSRKGSPVRLRSATKRLLGMTLDDRRRPSTVTSVRSRPSTARSRALSSVSTISSDSDIQPALMPSLFPNIPPTVNFVIESERVEVLPWELRKMLKWRMSPITPNVVKLCISRSGFRPTKKNHDWIGYWGKHMKAQGFQAIRTYQKVNHFPGSFQIGRKDRLWHNLSRMQMHHGKKEYGFFPQTYVLPGDMKLFKRAWEDGGSKQKWIIKPPASARGIGIRVVHKWNQIPKRRPVIVQKYLSRPYLINESKFDMRLYVYVTCYDPLRIYLYDDGLGRFASCKYSNSTKNLNNRYMHLTNYSVNKKNDEYESNADENVCQGHKWGLKALWGYMRKHGIDTNAIWEKIKDLIVKTIISSESCVNSMVKANVRRRYTCHELFGFDVMLDENLKPWIIEVNISPSLHSNSQLDMNIKGGMIKDLMNMAGFTIPDKREVVASPGAPIEPSRYVVPNGICIDKRLWPTQTAPDERAKHAYYCQRQNDEFVQATILDTLTPDDLRIMTETIDEDSRRGNFQRIFPSPISHKYLSHFELPRYYNLLMDAWVQKYQRMETRGIALLESFCQKGVHLENPTDDPNHQWAPPNTTIPRDFRTLSAPSHAAGKTGPHPMLPKLKKKTHYTSQTGSASSLATATNSPRPHTTRSIADPS